MKFYIMNDNRDPITSCDTLRDTINQLRDYLKDDERDHELFTYYIEDEEGRLSIVETMTDLNEFKTAYDYLEETGEVLAWN